jgi:hypothetical protein
MVGYAACRLYEQLADGLVGVMNGLDSAING